MSKKIIKELFMFLHYNIIDLNSIFTNIYCTMKYLQIYFVRYIFIIIFVLLITNYNVYTKNTYLKYSPREDALSNTVNSVIIIGDKPSSIGLTFFEMKYKLTISSHKRYDILLKEFHPTLNGKLKLNDFTYGSNKKVWWKCNKADDHIWESNINNRINGNNCPCCHGLKVVMSNCLATVYPNIAKQWHPTKNNELTPFDFTKSSEKKVWWKCDKGNDHEWESRISNIVHGNKCPCCIGKKAVLSNCLASTHPYVVKQWHPTKNNELTPLNVTAKSNKKVWWKCDKSDDHEWESKICNKTRDFSQLGCPFCSGHKVALSTCLATTHPEISKQWHTTKNLNLTPLDVTFGSGKKVWWKCNDNHEWAATINSVTDSVNLGGTGCPLCHDSNGERKIKNILNEMNIIYDCQKTFNNCKDIKKLRFDFYLPKYNVLIEYDGMQHFKPIDFFGGIKLFNETKKRDKIKTEYATKNNIPLLRISYIKFNLIEEEIKSFINEVNNRQTSIRII